MTNPANMDALIKRIRGDIAACDRCVNRPELRGKGGGCEFCLDWEDASELLAIIDQLQTKLTAAEARDAVLYDGYEICLLVPHIETELVADALDAVVKRQKIVAANYRKESES